MADASGSLPSPSGSLSKKKSGKKNKKNSQKAARSVIPVLKEVDGNAVRQDPAPASAGQASGTPSNQKEKQLHTKTSIPDLKPLTSVGATTTASASASSGSSNTASHEKPAKMSNNDKKGVTDESADFPISEPATTNPVSPSSTQVDSTGIDYADALKDGLKESGLKEGTEENVEDLPVEGTREEPAEKPTKMTTLPIHDNTTREKPSNADRDAEREKQALYDEYPSLYFEGNDNELAQLERDRANAYQAAGIRFAPFNIPLQRRLQTLAVLLHSLSIATTVSFFFFLCAIPLFWPLIIPYLLHMLLSKAATDGELRFRSERLRHSRIWRFFADYFPAKLHKTHGLPADRKYIFGYHPHGIISHGAFAAFATEALGFSEKFPGITNSLLTLDSNFRIPIYRDYILAMGLRSVSKESITNILSRGGSDGHGAGRAVTIVIGGARESLEAQPGTMRLVLGERKGFVKVAMRTGADIVPVLAFGENDLYDQVSPKSHPNLHRLQMFVLRTLKFTLPFLHGRGIFNYDVGLMPYRRPLNIVVGKPIRVTQRAESDLKTSEIDQLHGLYLKELEKMWERYKEGFAPERIEEMQILN
ncbi:diacylglycerol acyltransferase-domain-containing protein [Neurospora tetraspora]|uniref:diacylglycerol O-acyltransferase n=1 Tax=Neurospora tetraspora TaxID=94610 RepID=A0AAE0JM68_9PEZI|nr:diacylglycerol acyltransferase-domain-containing protein [Neurospora tetraspora]